MVALGLKMTSRYNELLSRGVQQRARALARVVSSAERASAQVAQQTSLEHIKPRRPNNVPPRVGRDQESISDVLKWRRIRTAESAGVGINLAELNQRAKHWIIQEIGTGERAVVRVANRANPTGRPAKDATYVRTVKPQTGRRISSALVWATDPHGNYTPPGAGTNQQLYLRKMIKFPEGVQGAAYSGAMPGRSQPGIIIRREIEARHFVQQGGEAGFRLYRGSVLTAARQQFQKARA